MGKAESELREKIKKLEKEIERLRQENATLKGEAAGEDPDELHYHQGEVSDAYDEFIESEGVSWKRAFDGALEPLAYCPDCHLVMLPVPSDNPHHLVCTRCKRKAPFGAQELPVVAQRVSDSYVDGL